MGARGVPVRSEAGVASHVLHREFKHSYPVVAKGKGVWLTDTSGKTYLDASGGAAVSCLGHNHPRVVAAMKRQLDRISFAHTSFFTNAPAEELADFLIRRAPAGFGRVYFVSGGSEANETAMKLARQIQLERGGSDRRHLIAREQSYHGNTVAALSLGGNPYRRAPYESLFASNVTHIAPCYAYRHQRPDESGEEYGRRAATALEEAITMLGPETVAAFFAETVVGATLGAVPAVPGYFREIRRICDRHGVLMVLDEVMCGSGRTGTLFACEQEGVVPDVITIAKGLGGGYQPIGAVLVRESLCEEMENGSGSFQHGFTYVGHALACASALEVQRTIEEQDLLGRVRTKHGELMERLDARFGEHPHVGDIRGRGFFIGLELVEDRQTKAPFGRERGLAGRIRKRAMANGLLCYPFNGTANGRDGDHVLLAPPYIISDGELDMLVDRLDKSLGEALAM